MSPGLSYNSASARLTTFGLCSVSVAALVLVMWRLRRKKASHLAGNLCFSLSGTQRAFSGGSTEGVGSAAYETDAAVAEYLHFHYGSPSLALRSALGSIVNMLGDAPARVAERCVKLTCLNCGRALDLGCAVGGTTFALARYFDEVVGIDTSAAFLCTAKQLQQDGEVRYRFATEGTASDALAARVPFDIQRTRCRFECVDATALSGPAAAKKGIVDFRLVVCCNVICRLANPQACLNALPAILGNGGVIVLITPYAWLEAWTPQENWIGNTPDTTSSAEITRIMMKLGFAEIAREEMPFLLAQNDRIYEFFVSELTAWQKL